MSQENASLINSEHGDRKECRFCLSDDDQKNLIAPCNCKGGSQFVHRKCLDQWRTTGIQDKAFTHCTTCNFEYQYEAKEPGCCTCSQETQYRLLIFRDVMTVLLIILGMMAAVGAITYAADKNNKYIPGLLHLCTNGTDTPSGVGVCSSLFGAYTLAGVVFFLASLGLVGLCGYCCVRCNCCQEDSCRSCDNCYCYWYGHPYYSSYYYYPYGYGGGGYTHSHNTCCICCYSSNSGGCGSHNASEASCGGACGSCANGGGANCNTGDMKGEGALIALIVVVVILALIGTFFLIYICATLFAAISARHADILRKRIAASEQRITDLSASGHKGWSKVAASPAATAPAAPAMMEGVTVQASAPPAPDVKAQPWSGDTNA